MRAAAPVTCKGEIGSGSLGLAALSLVFTRPIASAMGARSRPAPIATIPARIHSRFHLYRSLVLLLLVAGAARAQTFYVATNGADVPGNGTSANPWATIEYAYDQVPDGSTILVRPGTYAGRVRIDRVFVGGVTIRSETPYLARLRNNGTVIAVFDADGVTIEGFDVAHDGPGAGGLVVQVQDVGAETRRVTLRDNILHDSFNNDILKINNGASDVRVVGNMFYNQSGSDEHIDINSVDGVIVEDNVFFNDYVASGRAIPTGSAATSSHVVVKDSNGTDDEYVGARNVTIRRNLFLNWQGSTGSNFVLFGEDGTADYEAFDCLVENNLMLGNSPIPMRASFGIKGSRDITFRANTVVGDLPALAFAMRLNREGSNQQVLNARFYNNVWSDPTGTMGTDTLGSGNDFSDTPPADIASFTLSNNQYWNGGVAIPSDQNEAVNFDDDAARRVLDPQLPLNASALTPYWIPAQSQFNGGYATIRAAFLGLVELYGRPGLAGGGIGQALPAETPATDIRGVLRGPPPFDIGCYERVMETVLFADSFEDP